MKKLLLALLFTFSMNAQVFEVEGKSKDEIHSIINQWVAENYNSANNVIQMNDKEAGTIIVKGVTDITTKNLIGKAILKNNSYVTEYVESPIKYTLTINIRDGKYRLILDTVNNYDLSTEGISDDVAAAIKKGLTDIPYVSAKKEQRIIDATLAQGVLTKQALRVFVSNLGESIKDYIVEFNNNDDW